ncbi:MAG: hypothetical protein BroJett003_12580 [Planctomycetota bacterium]|nr:MAG: hypothetical protein BroJett003_12580 [Planctomycetota bacterium]
MQSPQQNLDHLLDARSGVKVNAEMLDSAHPNIPDVLPSETGVAPATGRAPENACRKQQEPPTLCMRLHDPKCNRAVPNCIRNPHPSAANEKTAEERPPRSETAY